MCKNTGVFEEFKLMALKEGYQESQIDTSLKYLKWYDLSIEIKSDSLFNIVNQETGEYLDEGASLTMVIERGHDCLEKLIEDALRNDLEIDVNVLLDELNEMFENVNYVINELDGFRYLAFNI